MSAKKKTPDQAAEAVILREAGYTLSAIATQLDISMSTTQRLLKKHGAVAGASTQALIEKAREDMLNAAFSLDSVQQTAAALALDDLTLTQQIRVKLATGLDSLDMANPMAFRALAASATTLKLTQEVGRRALPLEKLNQSMEVEELPELRITIMNEHDVNVMRAQQRLDEAETSGDAQGIADEIENLAWLANRKPNRIQQHESDDDDIIVIEN